MEDTSLLLARVRRLMARLVYIYLILFPNWQSLTYARPFSLQNIISPLTQTGYLRSDLQVSELSFVLRTGHRLHKPAAKLPEESDVSNVLVYLNLSILKLRS
jgi:hypothetical protein